MFLVYKNFSRGFEMDSRKWLVVACVVMGLIIIAFWVVEARAQTPPVSKILAMPDTVFSGDIPVEFEVSSTVPWDTGGGVGIYYRTAGSGAGDWRYAGGTYTSPLVFTPPFIGTTYEFASTVSDNAGNNEGYDFFAEAVTVYAPEVVPPDVPMLRWHWTHPTEGTAVVEYEAEWMVNDRVMVLQGIAVGDTTFAFVDVAYTPGQNQTLRVRGVDASNIVGPWSEWGEIWADVFPGVPGRPAGYLVITE